MKKAIFIIEIVWIALAIVWAISIPFIFVIFEQSEIFRVSTMMTIFGISISWSFFLLLVLLNQISDRLERNKK